MSSAKKRQPQYNCQPMQAFHYVLRKISISGDLAEPQIHKIEDTLDELGKDGWEAVTSIVADKGLVYLVFKRPRE